MDYNKGFKITSISRLDLEQEGFDASNVSDETMEILASKMCDTYVENSFWMDMYSIADDLQIKRKDK